MKERRKNTEDAHWIQVRWRPMMGWVYMVICIADFVIFPILWSILQAKVGGHVTDQWNPLTLQGAGLFHLAMGAIMGVAAWSRGQEKITAMSINSFNGSQSMEYSQDTTTQQPVNKTDRPPMRFKTPTPSRVPTDSNMPPLD